MIYKQAHQKGLITNLIGTGKAKNRLFSGSAVHMLLAHMEFQKLVKIREKIHVKIKTIAKYLDNYKW